MSKKLLFVVGARPNFIKLAPLCSTIKKTSGLDFKIVHTGQHYDQSMSDIFFDELEIPKPDFHLNIGSGSHAWQTGKIMVELEKLCMEHRFSAMVVIGDVNSTLAGALVASKLNLPVVHIESGLRSFNRKMPEEINRIATDHISDLLFAPTRLAMRNLEDEGLAKRSYFSGDVMFDMILMGQELAEKKNSILQKLKLKPYNYYLGTLHRPYNVDKASQLQEIMSAFSHLDKKVLLSVHPRLKKNLDQFKIIMGKNIMLKDPVGYLDFITLEKNAAKVITDSGGVQKEAFFLKRPCVTLRPETEWMETVEAGANILIKERTEQAILEGIEGEKTAKFEEKPYGDGHASTFIISTIKEKLLS
ncbi:MAG: UDP-N-acetylglucosamine 2-epimerase (non-hydrolyzing) [Saprospiraceae bacterium]|nr:UDP-N-acetylglucosamine 2-epimerase (non-hydrolyzing) [Saprospiraceae bacterium]MCB9322260.1 UDP-N-acetylglucosamine 2-epimerase (non-hydrolyzing) [Lewinellaceae bacterium]